MNGGSLLWLLMHIPPLHKHILIHSSAAFSAGREEEITTHAGQKGVMDAPSQQEQPQPCSLAAPQGHLGCQGVVDHSWAIGQGLLF